MPYKGYNFEDGVVLSESAAGRLTSEHLHRKALDTDKTHILSKKKYQAYVPDAMNRDQAAKLDDDGVVRAGQTIMPGDTLIAALRKKQARPEDRELARLHRSLVKPYQDSSVKWESDNPGKVIEVVKRGRKTTVHIKTSERMEIGDKLAGRHGNKGIVTAIIPDDDMPVTGDGKPLEILQNITGVPGRTNLGQILETAAGKIAQKTGETYKIKNFKKNADLHAQVSADLKKHGLKDRELVYDPKTKRKMGNVLVGPQHIIKLKHQVEKKMVARAGGPGYAYDRSMIPKGGGLHGAQALGTLGLYAMLAHGAKSNLREMQTVKSDAAQNDQFWASLQAGEPLPAPRPTFAYKKFTSYLTGLGLNVKKEGDTLQLLPITDKQVTDLSNGEIKDAGRMVRAKDLRPEKNGLFDPQVTGGIDGTKWGHIKLPEPLPNPLFSPAIQSLTGMTGKAYNSVIQGKKGIDKQGNLVDADDGITGGRAVSQILGKIDVAKDLTAARAALKNPSLKGNRLDRAHKKVKYLQALSSAGMNAKDAYMVKNIPVLPPSMRPLSQLPNGDLNVDDINHMYKGISLTAQQLKKLGTNVPESEKADLRAELYDGLSSLAGLGGHANREFRGILDVIGGRRVDRNTGAKPGSPKLGFFQKKLVQRKQDLGMRSTIIPEPSLGLDEVGLPRKAAMEMYRPFVVKELHGIAGMSPLQAQKAIKEGQPIVNKALERVVSERPVLLKRDPVLHKYGIQGFKPRIVGGKAVQIHPLVTGGFNADFDGDAMAAFVPVSKDAVDEARKMMPSNNLFSPATGGVMYTPTLESRLGLYGVTQVGQKTKESFKTVPDMERALEAGKVALNDQVRVAGKTNAVGRFMVAKALPSEMRKGFLSRKDALNGKGQAELLSDLARNHKQDYGPVVDKLKDLGNRWATDTAFSLGLDDIKPEKVMRKGIMDKADAQVAKIKKGPGSQRVKDAKIVKAYAQATERMHTSIKGMSEQSSNLKVMHNSGIKPGMDALRQILVSPMLIQNAKGETIPTPVRKSYSEGLDVSDYWTSMSGARKGIIQKVQSVSEPGYISKQVMNTMLPNIVIDEDCGTDKGISLPVDEVDVMDRHLAAPIKVGKRTLPIGTLITPGIRTTMRNNKVGKVVVRSPLKCNHGPGICKKCYGLMEDGQHPAEGTNVGVLAGQSVGERTAQLAMKAFHTGGTAASSAALVDDFTAVKQLLRMPKTVKNSATLSTASGVVTKVTKDPIGGTNVFVGRERHYVPQNLGAPSYGGKSIRKGMKIRRGDPLSVGPVNPHEMLPLAGIERVQSHMANTMHTLFKKEGIRRRNHEMIVKSMTNLSRVDDPGNSTGYLRGDYAPSTQIAKLNRTQLKGRAPIRHQPVLRGVDVLPLDMQEDWMAKLNHERLTSTVQEAAQRGWKSQLHGKHPIPPLVYGAEFGRGKKKLEY
jgi:DNA-directed RNA polymerase subunit beta'